MLYAYWKIFWLLENSFDSTLFNTCKHILYKTGRNTNMILGTKLNYCITLGYIHRDLSNQRIWQIFYLFKYVDKFQNEKTNATNAMARNNVFVWQFHIIVQYIFRDYTKFFFEIQTCANNGLEKIMHVWFIVLKIRRNYFQIHFWIVMNVRKNMDIEIK